MEKWNTAIAKFSVFITSALELRSIADDQSASFSVEAVQTAGGLNEHLDAGMGCFQCGLQRFGVLQVLAVADDNLLSGKTDPGDFLHQEANHAFAAPGFATDDNFTLFISGTDAPESQVAGNETNQAADPAPGGRQ